MISENVYLQYFCGLPSFQVEEPFHPTVFVDIRKRMGAVSFDKWNELIIEKAESMKPRKKKSISKNNSDNEDSPDNNQSISEKQEQDLDKKPQKQRHFYRLCNPLPNQQIVYPTIGHSY